MIDSSLHDRVNISIKTFQALSYFFGDYALDFGKIIEISELMRLIKWSTLMSNFFIVDDIVMILFEVAFMTDIDCLKAGLTFTD